VYPTTATAYTIPSTGVLAFTLATADTGVATITLRDSWTVAASTWSSNEIVVTVTEAKIATLTVSFDKATYSPGERAVITYTAKDSAGRGLATAAIASALTPLSNAVLTDVTTHLFAEPIVEPQITDILEPASMVTSILVLKPALLPCLPMVSKLP